MRFLSEVGDHFFLHLEHDVPDQHDVRHAAELGQASLRRRASLRLVAPCASFLRPRFRLAIGELEHADEAQDDRDESDREACDQTAIAATVSAIMGFRASAAEGDPLSEIFT